jgi:hypothetical protein
MFQPGLLRSSLESYVDLVGDLCGYFVKGQRGDQADDTAADSGRYSHKVRIAQRLAPRQTIHTSADNLKRSVITQGIKCARMDACPKCLSRAQDATMFSENLNRPVEPGSLLIRRYWHLDKNTFIYLFVSVILSNLAAMSSGIPEPKPLDY